MFDDLQNAPRRDVDGLTGGLNVFEVSDVKFL